MDHKIILFLVLSCGLWAQEASHPVSDGRTAAVSSVGEPFIKTLEAQNEQLKARIAMLERKLALTEAKMTALMNFYGANEQLQGLAAQENKTEHK